MMSLVMRGRTPVHMPARRDVFEFDDEVSQIFENMALRSIPGYVEVHRINAALMHRHMEQQKSRPYVVWDVGGSTCMAMKAFCNQLQSRPAHKVPMGVDYYVFDNSTFMCERAKQEMIGANVHDVDVVDTDLLEDFPAPHAILCNWTLQFIRPTYKQKVLSALGSALRHRGLFCMAQKESMSANNAGFIPRAMVDLYRAFRIDNGYTPQEIDAKTEALKNAMWPSSAASMRDMLDKAGFNRVYETYRWLEFTSLATIKVPVKS